VAHVGDKRDAYRVLVGRSEGDHALLKSKWDDNMYIKIICISR
jgi:hypothetical protein